MLDTKRVSQELNKVIHALLYHDHFLFSLPD